MNKLELSPSPPTATLAWKREALPETPARATLPIREFGRLIEDIRRARALLDAAGNPEEPVRLEHVVGNDPRD